MICFPRFEKAETLTDLVTILRTQHERGRTLTDLIRANANQRSRIIHAADQGDEMKASWDTAPVFLVRLMVKTPFSIRAFMSLSFTMLFPIVCFFHSCSLTAGQHGRTLRPIHAMHEGRASHTATVLQDGRVLIAGGFTGNGLTASAEVYDPDWKSGRFTSIPAMASQRFKFSAAVVQLGGGNILVCGGSKTIEIFDFLMKQFRTLAEMDQSYYYGTASLLKNGAVLIVGGYSDTLQSTDTAWIYKE